jgi:hypothetical protein
LKDEFQPLRDHCAPGQDALRDVLANTGVELLDLVRE